MSKTLKQIAEDLRNVNKKVQLIYAFNGTGKTRLSQEFKELISLEEANTEESELEEAALEEDELEDNHKPKVLYYNAFTEDLFYWRNSIDDNKLKIQPNNFIDWIIRDRGQDQNIITHFQRYTDDKLTPFFIEDSKVVYDGEKRKNVVFYPEVGFSFLRGTERNDNVKISKAEESSFIWSIFYSLVQEVVEILKDPLGSRDDDYFDNLDYVFIDDPVSSLDDNHLIELAVDIAKLVKKNQSDVKFLITTHNPLFYNVISNELNNKEPNRQYTEGEPNEGINKWIYKTNQSIKYRLNKQLDGKYCLTILENKTPFSYHLQLLREIQTIKNTPNQLKKYHLNFLRNILEKTSTFLGYTKWERLLPTINGEPDPHLNRLLNLSSHSAHAGEEIGELQENDRDKLIELVNYLESNYKFSELIQQNEAV